ncbi:MAG: EAL domain-containing protein [Alphaproteobacteria bacterium]
MSLITHIIVAGFYLGIAALIGWILPQFAPAGQPGVAAAYGALVALGGLFVHHVFVRAGRDQSVREELKAMRRGNVEVMDELESSIAQMRRMDDELTELRGRSGTSPEVVAEMKVLQTLLQQLAHGQTKGAPALPPGFESETEPMTKTKGGAKPAERAPSRPWVPPPPFAARSEGEVVAAIRDAIASNRIDVYLQPVVRLPQRKVVYYEALTRLRSADGRLIEPHTYLGPAETCGLIGAIDNGLLFRCVQLLRRTERRRPDLAFFCNVSGHTIADATFFPQFVEFLEQNSQLAQRLVLEFPYDGFLGHDAATRANLDRLMDYGYRFSVDHVATLDVPARDLARRGVTFVKLEAGALLARMRQPGGGAEARRLRTVLGITGINLVVEKIENEADVIELLDLPIELGQGFRFGEPRLAREAA